MLRHGDVEGVDVFAEVGGYRLDLAAAIRLVHTGDENANRLVEFADAIDLAGELIFRAEGCLQKTFDDLGVGKIRFLVTLFWRVGRKLRIGGECRTRK